MSHSCAKTVLTEETKRMATNFHDNVARECPYRKSMVLVYAPKQPVNF